MKTLRISEIFIPIEYSDKDIESAIKKRIGKAFDFSLSWKISRKSIDARKKQDLKYVLSVDVVFEKEVKVNDKKSTYVTVKDYFIPKVKKQMPRPVVVGFGPAGIFAALTLAKAGLEPIVIERGSCVEERKKHTDALFLNRILNRESNVQFGEGGAGTFSDGKLNTGIKDVRIKYVLNEFVENGAPEEILYDSKPHIGTDKLIDIVKNIREKIKKLGGTILFDTKMIDIISENGKIKSIKAIKDNEELEFETNNLILAIGHSARDSFKMINRKNIFIEPKAFSVGVRIEHRAELINKAQYGVFHHKLPTADYKLFTHLKNGRGVYTFCMCPGGQVVASSSDFGLCVTNGMSNYQRDGENSNSAVLVNIDVNDFYTENPLDGMYFQEKIERNAFEIAGANYNAPSQRFADFVNGKESKNFGEVKATYKPGVSFCDMNNLFPKYISESIKEGIKIFSGRIKGFDMDDALLTGPETRSSSPIRIKRDENLMSVSLKGLYPCAEGAGYAGGITSAAVDGIKCAEMIINTCKTL